MERNAVEELVRAARVWAAETVSWIAPAIYAAQIRLLDDLPHPAAIDRHGRVYVGSRWISSLVECCGGNERAALPQVAYLIVHEIMHWNREHAAIADEISAQPRLWNIAADMEINDGMPKELEAPSWGGKRKPIYPWYYQLEAGNIAEWYYRRLLEQQPARQSHDSRAHQQQTSSSQDDAPTNQDSASSDLAQQPSSQHQQPARQPHDEHAHQQQTPSSQDDVPTNQNSASSDHAQQASSHPHQQNEADDMPGHATQSALTGSSAADNAQTHADWWWDEGSGVHGQPRPWELAAEDPSAPALSDFDRWNVREAVAHRILDAEKTRGTVPAGWVRWAKELLKPQVNWRQLLKRVVRGAISEGFGQRLDYSYRRVHRRAALYSPLVLPSLQGERRPHVVVVVDTSGSIGDVELCQALTEVRGVLEQLRTRITIIPCDAVPYQALQVLSRRDWELARGRMQGGGGTDMVAGIRAALDYTPAPDAIIVLTDGYTPFPEQPPHPTEPPIIWGIWQYNKPDPPTPPCPPWKKRDIVLIPVTDFSVVEEDLISVDEVDEEYFDEDDQEYYDEDDQENW
jgi:predicted metal-dependent peptidase